MTQEQFAELLWEMPLNTYKKYERGDTRIQALWVRSAIVERLQTYEMDSGAYDNKKVTLEGRIDTNWAQYLYNNEGDVGVPENRSSIE